MLFLSISIKFFYGEIFGDKLYSPRYVKIAGFFDDRGFYVLDSDQRHLDFDFDVLFSHGRSSNVVLNNGAINLNKDSSGFYSNGYWESPVFDTQNEYILWDWVDASVDFNGMQENLLQDGSFEDHSCLAYGFPVPCSISVQNNLMPPFVDNVASDGVYSIRLQMNDTKKLDYAAISNMDYITDFDKTKNLHVLFDAKHQTDGSQFEFWLVLGNETNLTYNGAIQRFDYPMENFEEQYFVLNFSQFVDRPVQQTRLGYRFFEYYQNDDFPHITWIDNLRFYQDSPISYKVRTSLDGVVWSDWNDARYFFAERTAPGGEPGRYIQFNISLKTYDNTKTPSISDLDLDYSKAFPFNITHFYEGPSTIDPLIDSTGAHGFVNKDDEGNLLFDDGQKIRFWAAQVGDDSVYYMSSHESADNMCKKIAQMGFNMIKVTPPPFGYTEYWERFDYMLRSCGEQGVYIYIQLNGGWPQGINPDYYEYRKSVLRDVMNHTNQYTGVKYKDDPQFVFVQLLNEDRLFHSWYGNVSDIYIGSYSDALDREWWAWLAENYPTYDDLTNSWNDGTGVVYFYSEIIGMANYPNNIKRIEFDKWTTYSDKRFYDTSRFYAHIYEMYYNEMVNYLKDELRINSLIVPNNHYYGMAELKERKIADVIDQHSYYPYVREPKFGEILVQEPQSNSPYYNIITYISLDNVDGYPLTVSESNYHIPHLYSVELPLFISAYSSFQDWDQWTYFKIHSRSLSLNKVPEALDSWYDPGRMAFMPAASKIFINSYVSPANKVINLSYSNDTVYNFKYNRALKDFNIPGFSNAFVWIHGIQKKDFDAPRDKTIQEYYNEFNLQNPSNPFVSDTGELTLDSDKNILTINSLKAQGYTGMIGGNLIDFHDVSVTVSPSGNNFSSLIFVPLDENNLGSSNRILLTAAGRTEASKVRWGADKQGYVNPGCFWCNEHYGDEPVLVEGVNAEIILKNVPEEVSIIVLNSSGQRTQRLINYARIGQDIKFNISDNDETLWYEILIGEASYSNSQVINLNPGWNLISLNISGELYSSDLNSKVVLTYENSNWIIDYENNNPFRLNSLQGYYVYSNERKTLILHGFSLTDTASYPMINNNWNLFSMYRPNTYAGIYGSPPYSLYRADLSENIPINLNYILVPGEVYWSNLIAPGLSPPT